jgi:hypothetical protein
MIPVILFEMNLFQWDRQDTSGAERKKCSGLEGNSNSGLARNHRSGPEENLADWHSRFRAGQPNRPEWRS